MIVHSEEIISVTRAASDGTTLSDLSISHRILSPTFDNGVTNYSVNVTNDVTSLAVTLRVNDSTTTGSRRYTSNRWNIKGVPLVVGRNDINILVTAEGGSTS